MPWAWGTGVLACLVLCCTLICLESIRYSFTEEGSWTASEFLFFFQTWSYLAQVFEEGGENSRSVQWPSHSLPCDLVLAEQSVPSGTCLVTLEWLHNCPSFLYVVFFGQSFSCRLNPFLGSGIFHMCNYRGFFCLPLFPGPWPYFSPSAYMKGSSLCPICTGHRPEGFHHNGDPAVLSSGAAECKNTILDPEELTASLLRSLFRGRGWDMKSHAQLGEVEWVLKAMQQDSGRTRNKSQFVWIADYIALWPCLLCR